MPRCPKLSANVAHRKLTLRELTEQALLQEAVPAALCQRPRRYPLHPRPNGLYLEPAVGEVGIYNILKMAREGLRHELTMSLRKVVEGLEVTRCFGLRVKTNGNFTSVNLTFVQ